PQAENRTPKLRQAHQPVAFGILRSLDEPELIGQSKQIRFRPTYQGMRSLAGVPAARTAVLRFRPETMARRDPLANRLRRRPSIGGQLGQERHRQQIGGGVGTRSGIESAPAFGRIPCVHHRQQRPELGNCMRKAFLPRCGKYAGDDLPFPARQEAAGKSQAYQRVPQLWYSMKLIGRRTREQRLGVKTFMILLKKGAWLRQRRRLVVDVLPQDAEPQEPFEAVGLPRRGGRQFNRVRQAQRGPPTVCLWPLSAGRRRGVTLGLAVLGPPYLGSTWDDAKRSIDTIIRGRAGQPILEAA